VPRLIFTGVVILESLILSQRYENQNCLNFCLTKRALSISAFLFFSDNIGSRKLFNLQICPTLRVNVQGAAFLILIRIKG
jgi:hypothetical protein